MIVVWIVATLVVVCFGLIVFYGAPYVPSQRKYIRRAFRELYPISEHDVVLDLGSGDGIVLRAAAEKGARAIGYELNPLLVIISRLLSQRYSQIEVRLADFWNTPIPDDTTLIYVFAVTRDSKKIITKLQQEANRLGRSLFLMVYGDSLAIREVYQRAEPYNLYRFDPLQPDQP